MGASARREKVGLLPSFVSRDIPPARKVNGGGMVEDMSMRTSHDWTIDSVKSLTLNDVKNYYKQGIVTQALYDEYCHLWQTSAPRYEVQACSCAECLERGTIR